MNDFEIAEQKGRDLFKSFLDQIGATGQPTVNQFDEVDYFFQVQGKKLVAELKVRYAYYDEYIIEESKVQALQRKKQEYKLDNAYYICFFKNRMYIFALSDILKYGKPEQKYCKRNTVLDNGYKLKDVLLLPTNRAIRMDLTDKGWIKYVAE